MTEGMATRSRTIEDQLTKLTELLAKQDAKMDALYLTVHQHSEAFDVVQKSLASQQSVAADMMVKFSTTDKPSAPTTQPPLLPLPAPTSANPYVFSIPLPNPNRPPKIELPLFSGDGVFGWLFQANHFFASYQTPLDNQLHTAAFYMTGPALQWFQWMQATNQFSSWEKFSRQLELRFGPSTFLNHKAQLFKLKQQTTVVKYLEEFECLSTRVTNLTTASLLNCFLSGLKDDIQQELYILRPTDLHEAIGLAKLVEDKCNAARVSSPYPRTHFPRPLPAPSLLVAAGPRPPSLPIKRLTPFEMATRREKGLCFNCDAKFVPGHKCSPAQFLCLMVDTEEDTTFDSPPPTDTPELLPQIHPTPQDVDTTPCISFHALTGQLVPSTLKLAGSIHGHPVVVLIDGGSTNNFIQSHLVKHLGLTVHPSPHLRVTVGNGESMGCGGECRQVSMKLGDTSFSVDLLLLPIYGADVVLGVQWLSGLGPVVFDYRNLWMEFIQQDSYICLQGLTRLELNYITPSSLVKQLTNQSTTQYWHLEVEHSPTDPDPKFGPTAPPSFIAALRLLLTSFADVFSPSIGLPPQRPFDYCIPLLPNTTQVNVKPYRYPHFQKTEIERLVTEMISDGIIQPSTSPYSAPVLLVKKRDGSWRFYVDYRALNAVTVKDHFPIPTVEELFDEIAGAHVFSKLDLRAGYHQVRIHPPDIEKTAFRTHDGHYEFKVTPFGLSNAPSTFQALMNSVFKGILRRFVLVFFDDILIYSTDWDHHLQHLQAVFSILRSHHLHAKQQKCEFGNAEIGYLGHRISGQGVSVDPSKISMICKWPQPRAVRDLRAFLGLTGYYRRFVRNYAALTAPLTILLKKDSFTWSPTPRPPSTISRLS
ncbi:uncharacterized protein LOC120270395 [Dioscorea cayenensis subsp. rotundata]|uniref:Uncharacterized protein LOC120270395 n=1 Tax=Dioscorea cayennensis subsp. rotundata TaxID=55577 RepID=A0AB40C0Z8_DIOCR|nr:uncharacterized protein LOC120270395 [Dioscorea cayenensis subsp. rotundata]